MLAAAWPVPATAPHAQREAATSEEAKSLQLVKATLLSQGVTGIVAEAAVRFSSMWLLSTAPCKAEALALAAKVTGAGAKAGAAPDLKTCLQLHAAGKVAQANEELYRAMLAGDAASELLKTGAVALKAREEEAEKQMVRQCYRVAVLLLMPSPLLFLLSLLVLLLLLLLLRCRRCRRCCPCCCPCCCCCCCCWPYCSCCCCRFC
jgi:hypothetical protein